LEFEPVMLLRHWNILSAGQIVSAYSEGSQQYDVIVRAEEQYRRDRSNFKYFAVASSNGGTVDLERVVKVNEGVAPSSINRLNRQRQVTVSAGPTAEYLRSDAVAKLQHLQPT
jgi:multidrug efflux pump subunit AcrB